MLDMTIRGRTALDAGVAFPARNILPGGDRVMFFDYGGPIFLSIRAAFEINPEDYLSSLREISTEKLSEGASGAFMVRCSQQQTRSLNHLT